MGTTWIREFTGGLDTRRLPETTPGGVLIEAENGHFTRGGEFEKRAAFVAEYELPPGTVGLANGKTGVYVFGSIAEPSGLPTGVNYQQLQHPDGSTPLLSVPSFDLSAGKIYAVGVFGDGTTHHFYNGVRVEDWFDGRARCTFDVTAGSVSPAVAAEGSFTITGGTLGAGNEITSVTVDAVTITSAAVAHTGDNATTATDVAANITANTSSPNYTAAAVGAQVVITAALTGTAANGRVVVANVGGDVTVGTPVDMAGGEEAGTSRITDITIDGVSAITAPIEWTTSNAATATAIAAAINAALTVPEYEAISNENQVIIQAELSGTEPNGKVVVVAVELGFGVTPLTGLAMSGGAVADDTFVPGEFVKTFGNRMLALSGPNLHGSGIAAPTEWTTDVVGAFFVDMSSQASGAEELQAVAIYQNFIAVFAEANVQIEFVDPDPALNRLVQVLNNTGTISPLSVTQFSDSDLFYLSESGLRSLRARDSSNAASTNDIGVPIDTLITAKLRTLTAAERARVTGAIEPQDGRFWLSMKDTIFVFSFFGGAKVSAWSTYEPGFEVEQMCVFNRRVHLRSGDTIHVYGGLGAEQVFDDTVATVGMPFLDADSPTKMKQLQGFDAAATGEWTVYMRMDPTNIAARDKIGVIAGTTFLDKRIPGEHSSTHFSPLLKTSGSGPAKLGSIVIHHDGDADED